jgi:DNA-binding NarL/FixJ family response regulator
MARYPHLEILGIEPWPPRLSRELPRRTRRPVTLLVTPRANAITCVADRYGGRDVVVLATDPSAVEAALLIQAGADAYLTDAADLPEAIEALAAGEAWLSPVAATAVCRLARLTGDPAFDLLAALARAVAAGQSWPTARRASGLTDTRSALARLRRML